ncbi:transcriptional regulator [Methyloterricola oryzae]|uniref:transcriptional regulator n=1 Tax=Methyloterricola oryzae TaxID=1495050 RepID=UPI000A722933|nr:transcriptional regulator [Methyloterricola oryzae]
MIPQSGGRAVMAGLEETRDWAACREAALPYSYERFARAKVFVFRKWVELAAERRIPVPTDLSGSCKFGSLFMNRVFGGALRGHYQHQYNLIEGRIVDLSHDAVDVGRMHDPYLNEPGFFDIPEQRASLSGCLPRVERWALEFLAEIQAAGQA